MSHPAALAPGAPARARRLQRADVTTLPAVVAGSYLLMFGRGLPVVAVLCELTACLAAAVSGRRPALGGLMAGTAAAMLAVVHQTGTGLMALLVLVPVASAAAHGAWLLAAGLTAFLLPSLTLVDAGWSAEAGKVAPAGAGALLLLLVPALLAGAAVGLLGRHEGRRVAHLAEHQRRERRLLATELHDTVARDLTRAILGAEQLRDEATDPGQRDRLETVLRDNQQALHSLRATMLLLRSSTEAAPVRTLPVSLPELLEERRRSLTEAGFRPVVLCEGDLTAVPGATAEILKRIVTEATTNVVRHGEPGSDCQLMIEAGAARVELACVNTAGRRRFTHGNNLGLAGLDDLVSTVGGTLEVSQTGTTWALRAALPCSHTSSRRQETP